MKYTHNDCRLAQDSMIVYIRLSFI